MPARTDTPASAKPLVSPPAPQKKSNALILGVILGEFYAPPGGALTQPRPADAWQPGARSPEDRPASVGLPRWATTRRDLHRVTVGRLCATGVLMPAPGPVAPLG